MLRPRILNNCSRYFAHSAGRNIWKEYEEIVDIIVKFYLLYMYLSSIYFVKQIIYDDYITDFPITHW